MAYEKRVCVLKQVKKGFSADGSSLSGAVYAERLGDALTVTPRIAGLAPVKEGAYALSVWVSGQIFCLELRGGEPLKINGAPSLTSGFAALVAYVRGEAEPIAYGFCGTAPATCHPLLSAFREEQGKGAKGEKKKGIPVPVPFPPNQTPSPAPNMPAVPNVVPLPDDEPEITEEETEDSASSFREGACSKYDDEAIAAANYYAGADDEDEDACSACQEETGKAAHGHATRKNDGAVHPLEFPRGKLTYYNEVKDRLDRAFKKFPRDTRLQAIFPQSEWVNSSGALLGVIYENGTPRYLCVAVEKEGEPPENMRAHCSFVPESPLSDEKGFYVVFQDADTGAYVTVSEG